MKKLVFSLILTFLAIDSYAATTGYEFFTGFEWCSLRNNETSFLFTPGGSGARPVITSILTDQLNNACNANSGEMKGIICNTNADCGLAPRASCILNTSTEKNNCSLRVEKKNGSTGWVDIDNKLIPSSNKKYMHFNLQCKKVGVTPFKVIKFLMTEGNAQGLVFELNNQNPFAGGNSNIYSAKVYFSEETAQVCAAGLNDGTPCTNDTVDEDCYAQTIGEYFCVNGAYASSDVLFTNYNYEFTVGQYNGVTTAADVELSLTDSGYERGKLSRKQERCSIDGFACGDNSDCLGRCNGWIDGTHQGGDGICDDNADCNIYAGPCRTQTCPSNTNVSPISKIRIGNEDNNEPIGTSWDCYIDDIVITNDNYDDIKLVKVLDSHPDGYIDEYVGGFNCGGIWSCLDDAASCKSRCEFDSSVECTSNTDCAGGLGYCLPEAICVDYDLGRVVKRTGGTNSRVSLTLTNTSVLENGTVFNKETLLPIAAITTVAQDQSQDPSGSKLYLRACLFGSDWYDEECGLNNNNSDSCTNNTDCQKFGDGSTRGGGRECAPSSPSGINRCFYDVSDHVTSEFMLSTYELVKTLPSGLGGIWNNAALNDMKAVLNLESGAGLRVTSLTTEYVVKKPLPIIDQVATDINGDGQITIAITGDSIPNTWMSTGLVISRLEQFTGIKDCTRGSTHLVDILQNFDGIVNDANGTYMNCTYIKGSVRRPDYLMVMAGVNDLTSGTPEPNYYCIGGTTPGKLCNEGKICRGGTAAAFTTCTTNADCAGGGKCIDKNYHTLDQNSEVTCGGNGKCVRYQHGYCVGGPNHGKQAACTRHSASAIDPNGIPESHQTYCLNYRDANNNGVYGDYYLNTSDQPCDKSCTNSNTDCLLNINCSVNSDCTWGECNSTIGKCYSPCFFGECLSQFNNFFALAPSFYGLRQGGCINNTECPNGVITARNSMASLSADFDRLISKVKVLNTTPVCNNNTECTIGGFCQLGTCNVGSCLSGPNAGAPCTTNRQCSQCTGNDLKLVLATEPASVDLIKCNKDSSCPNGTACYPKCFSNSDCSLFQTCGSGVCSDATCASSVASRGNFFSFTPHMIPYNASSVMQVDKALRPQNDDVLYIDINKYFRLYCPNKDRTYCMADAIHWTGCISEGCGSDIASDATESCFENKLYCTTNTDCSSTRTPGIVCSNNYCKTPGVCNTITSLCTSGSTDSACIQNSDCYLPAAIGNGKCDTGLCVTGTCASGKVGETCQNNKECGTCRQGNLGGICAYDEECDTYFCDLSRPD